MDLTTRRIAIVLASIGLCLMEPPAWANPVENPPGSFVRGDANNDAVIDISDAVFLLSYLFLGGASPACPAGTDINNDRNVDISDGVFLLNYLFLGGSAPPVPFPGCALDPGGLSCTYSSCHPQPAG